MTSTLPPGRYSSTTKPARSRRSLAWLAGVVVALVGVVVAVVAYQKFATSEIDAEVTSFDIVDNSKLDLTLKVTRDDPSREAVCIVRARSQDGSETGRREVLVPRGDDQTVLITTAVLTSRPPGMGDLYGCSFDVPEYLAPH